MVPDQAILEANKRREAMKANMAMHWAIHDGHVQIPVKPSLMDQFQRVVNNDKDPHAKPLPLVGASSMLTSRGTSGQPLTEANIRRNYPIARVVRIEHADLSSERTRVGNGELCAESEAPSGTWIITDGA